MFDTFVSHLELWNYRNFPTLSLETKGASVVITGKNGAGKTNILEALSLLAPGSGLRQAPKQALPRHTPKTHLKQEYIQQKNISQESKQQKVLTPTKEWQDGKAKETNQHEKSTNNQHEIEKTKQGQETHQTWSIHADVITPRGHFSLHTKPNDKGTKRLVFINDEAQKKQSSLNQVLSLLWITPRSDHFFIDSSDIRRRFLDRMTANFYHDHTHYCSMYEKACKTRLHLLKEQGNIPKNNLWLSALEKQIAEYGMIVMTNRLAFVDLLNTIPSHDPFPKAELEIKDPMTQELTTKAAVDIELDWQQKLSHNRMHDLKAGSTSIGPQKSDFQATHKDLCMPARFCSTGEQKSLLLSLLLSCATLHHDHHKNVIFLLDEVTSHLDHGKIDHFLQTLLHLKSQFWITGVNPKLYHSIKDQALFYHIEENHLFHT